MTKDGSAIDRGALAPFAQAELARRSLLPFCTRMDPRFMPARHLLLLIDRLEALERRDIRRLIVAMPPRHGKSRTCSQLFPAWFIGRSPELSIVLASYGSELAEQNSRQVREIVADRGRYPFADVSLREDSRAVNRWATTAGGVLVAAGVGSSLTGFGADLLVVDDPVRDRADADSPTIRDATWDWYLDVARTRLQSGAASLCISTRWHEDDLVGRILNSRGAAEWETLVLPAVCDSEQDPMGRAIGEPLWPEKYPVSELPSVERGDTSSRSWSALYQQQPSPAEGRLFRAAWMANRYTSVPEGARLIQAVDGAWKTGVQHDFSVIATWAATKTHYYLFDIWRQRVEFPVLRAAAIAQYELHRPSEVVVEDAASGTAVIQALKAETNLPIIAVTATGSKESRAEAVTPLFESGRVLLPQNAPAWLDVWIDEHLRFPTGQHDDTVDTTSLALKRLQKPRSTFCWGKLSTAYKGFNIVE
jgi:predicted phage terminase large subunit-like protein